MKNSEYVEDIKNRANDMRRDAIRSLLQQCNDDQNRVFNMMYKGGVYKILPEKLDWAYAQCAKTVERNGLNK